MTWICGSDIFPAAVLVFPLQTTLKDVAHGAGGAAWRGVVGRGGAWRGVARRGMALLGGAWRGALKDVRVAWRGGAWRGAIKDVRLVQVVGSGVAWWARWGVTWCIKGCGRSVPAVAWPGGAWRDALKDVNVLWLLFVVVGVVVVVR